MNKELNKSFLNTLKERKTYLKMEIEEMVEIITPIIGSDGLINIHVGLWEFQIIREALVYKNKSLERNRKNYVPKTKKTTCAKKMSIVLADPVPEGVSRPPALITKTIEVPQPLPKPSPIPQPQIVPRATRRDVINPNSYNISPN